MSAENAEEVNDVENTLITPEDKTYGTSAPTSETQSQQKRTIFAKIRQFEARSSHISVVQTFVSHTCGSGESSKSYQKVFKIFINFNLLFSGRYYCAICCKCDTDINDRYGYESIFINNVKQLIRFYF